MTTTALQEIEVSPLRRKWPRYPDYSPFKEAWLHKAPAHWSGKRLKFAVSLINSKQVAAESDLPYVGMENVESATGRYLPGGESEQAADGLSNSFQTGDVLFGKLRPYLAKALCASFNGLCSSELLVLRPRDFFPHYLLYLLLTDGFVKVVDSSTYGAKMPRASWEFIGNLRVPLPPLDEQRAIAAFLDRETARIDELIAKKQRLIELLKEKRQAIISRAVTKGLNPDAPMKPSGIDWLGDVPGHWEIAPLYSRYWLELGKMLDAKQITGEHLVPYLRNIDVQWDYVNTYSLPEMDIESHEYRRFILANGDLLVCEGGEVGRAAIWKGELPLCAYQKALHRLRPRLQQERARFLFYVLRHAAGTGIFLASGNPNTIPHLTGEQLRVYRFPFPPAKEEDEIVEYLDARIAEYDRLTQNVERAIARLRQYRSALITAAVTGQIDVRHYGKEAT